MSTVAERVSKVRESITAALAEKGIALKYTQVDVGEVVGESTTAVPGWHNYNHTGRLRVVIKDFYYKSRVTAHTFSEGAKGFNLPKIVNAIIEMEDSLTHQTNQETSRTNRINNNNKHASQINDGLGLKIYDYPHLSVDKSGIFFAVLGGNTTPEQAREIMEFIKSKLS